MQDAQCLSPPPKILPVTPEKAKNLETPYYVVRVVPDLEPKLPEELAVKASLEEFMSREEKGVLLDMCFNLGRTRMIELAERLGWACVEGTHVIGYQIEEQYRLWFGEEKIKELDREGAWRVLAEQANTSVGFNF